MNTTKNSYSPGEKLKRFFIILILSVFVADSLIFNVAYANANFDEMKEALSAESSDSKRAEEKAVDLSSEREDKNSETEDEKVDLSEREDEAKDDEKEKRSEEVLDLDLIVPEIKRVYPEEVSAFQESQVYLDVDNHTFSLRNSQPFYYDLFNLFFAETSQEIAPVVLIDGFSVSNIQIVDENTLSFLSPSLPSGKYGIELIDQNLKLELKGALTYSDIQSDSDVVLDQEIKSANSLELNKHREYAYANRFSYGTSFNQLEIFAFRLTTSEAPVQINKIYLSTASSGVFNADLNTIQLMEDENGDGQISPEENIQYGGNAVASLQNNTIYLSSPFTLLENRAYDFILRTNISDLVSQDFLSIGLSANSQAIHAVSAGQPVVVVGSDIDLLKHTSPGTPNINLLGTNGNSLDFGSFPFDNSRLTFSAKNVAIQNTGDADLNINDVRFGDNSFLKDTFLELPFTLRANEIKNIVLGYNPAISGTVSTTLYIQGSTARENTGLELNVSGVSQNSTDLISSFSSNILSYNFGEFLADENENSYSSYPLVLKNNGTANLTVNNITVSNNVFSLEENLVGVIKPGESKETQIKFNPEDVDTFTGNIQVNYQGTTGTQTSVVELKGTAVSNYEKGKITLSSSFLNFEKRQIGTNARKNIRITNTGTKVLRLTGITNPNSPFRIVNNTLPNSLEIGMTADLLFEYNPTNNLVSLDSVSLTSDDPNEPVTKIVLVGEGVSTALPTVEEIKTKDQDENGKLDALELTFSEPMDTTKTSTAGFSVQGFTILPNGVYQNSQTFKISLNESTVGTALTPIVSYARTIGVIQDIAGEKLDDFVLTSTDSAAPVIATARIFDDGVLNIRETGIDEDDYVEIVWSENTNKFPITAENVNSILQLRSGTTIHNWGTVSSSWQRADKLVIYLSTQGNGTIADSDSLYVQPTLQLTDLANNYASGVIQLTGSLSPASKPTINSLSFTSGVVPNGVSSTTITVNLSDADGMGNISSVSLDLSPLGGSNLSLNNIAPSFLATTGVFVNSNVTLMAGIPTGVTALTVTVIDKQGLKDSRSANLQILNSIPKVDNVFYTPSQGNPGQSNLNLIVQVSDQNTINDIASVRANLSTFSGLPNSVNLTLMSSPSFTQGTYMLSGGFSIPVNTPAGSYTFPITALDKQGAGETSLVGTLVVQNVAPVVTATSITPQIRKPGENATAQATISDGNGLADISTVSLDLTSIATASGVSMTTNVSLTPTSVSGVYSNNAISAPVGTPAGTYTLPLTIRDKAGNTAVTTSIRLNIEDVPAMITAASFTPSSGLPGGTTSVRVIIDEPNGVNDIEEVTIDLVNFGLGIQALQIAPSSTSIYELKDIFVQSPKGFGAYSFQVKVLGVNGNSDTRSVNFNITNKSPEILSATYSPLSGVPNSSGYELMVRVEDLNTINDIQSVRVNMSALSSSLQNVDLILDTNANLGIGTYILSGGFSVPVNTPAGSYTFPITALDKQGAGETSLVGTFVVQNVSPVVTATSITPQIRKPGENATVQATISDGNGIADVSTVSLDLSSIATASGVSMTTNVSLLATTTPGVFSNNAISAPVGTPAGTYTLPLTIRDKAGNTAVTNSIRLNIEDVPATITAASFTPSSGLPGSTTTVRAVIDELNGVGDIEKVTLDLSAFNLNAGNLSLAPSTTNIYELKNIKIPFPEGIGTYSFELKAVGVNGNSASKTLTFSVLNGAPDFSSISISEDSLVPEETSFDIALLIQDGNGGFDISTSTVFADLSEIGGLSQQSFTLFSVQPPDPLNRFFKVSGLKATSGISAGTKTIDFVVKDNHGEQTMASRDVFVLDLPTTLEEALFSPQNILSNGSDPTTLSVRVSDLNGFSNMQVYADLNNLGMGIKELLHDDGTHGDLIADDGIYTLNQIKAIAYTPAGDYQIVITAQEGDNKKTITTTLIVEEAGQVQIKSIIPNSGTIRGNQVVLLTASSTTVDFRKTLPRVDFIRGGQSNQVVILGAHSANQIFIKTPNHSAGYVDVKLTSGNQVITRKNGYKYIDIAEIKPLEIVPTSLTLNEGENKQMVLKTNTPVQSNTTVTLLSVDTTRLTMPASIVIPSGYTQVAFSVTTFKDSDFEDNHVVVYAGATNYLSATGVVKIIDLDLPSLSISPSPVSLLEGTATSVVVTLGKVATTDTSVKLVSSDNSKLTISPISINVPAGSTVAEFNLVALEDINENNEVVLITAEAGVTFVSTTANVTIIDKDDLTPPTVVSVSPANGSTGINVTDNIVVTFSEGIDGTMISSNISLLSGATVISSSVTYNDSNYTVTIDPESELSRGVVHTVKVLVGIKDKNGNPLVAEYQSSFTTQSASTSSSSRRRRSSRRSSSYSLAGYYNTGYNANLYNQYTPYNSYNQYNPYNQYPQYNNQYTPYNQYPQYTNTQYNPYTPQTPYNQSNLGTTTSYQSGSRAEFIKNILIQNNIPLAQGGASSFRDVTPDNPYYIYIVTAEKMGLIQGFGNGTFRPNSSITPEDINKINSILFRR